MSASANKSSPTQKAAESINGKRPFDCLCWLVLFRTCENNIFAVRTESWKSSPFVLCCWLSTYSDSHHHGPLSRFETDCFDALRIQFSFHQENRQDYFQKCKIITLHRASGCFDSVSKCNIIVSFIFAQFSRKILKEIPAQQFRNPKQHLSVNTVTMENTVTSHAARAKLPSSPRNALAQQCLGWYTQNLPYSAFSRILIIGSTTKHCHNAAPPLLLLCSSSAPPLLQHCSSSAPTLCLWFYLQDCRHTALQFLYVYRKCLIGR